MCSVSKLFTGPYQYIQLYSLSYMWTESRIIESHHHSSLTCATKIIFLTETRIDCVMIETKDEYYK